LISPLNAEELVEEGGIEVLHTLLTACLERVTPKSDPDSVEMEAIHWIAHSLSGLAHFESGLYRTSSSPMMNELLSRRMSKAVTVW
jgi:hypothetical protein